MSLESATYVNQLVVANPDGADPKGQGDDHLRLIKNTLKNTFPNLNAAVTVTPAELNSLGGGNAIFKTGMILLWSGSIETIPAGWALCNGTAGTPDLRDRFIVGSGGAYGVGSTGGTTTHSHTISVAGTALDVSQIPPHTHTIWRGKAVTNTSTSGIGGDNMSFDGTSSSTGSGATHTHGASSNVVDNRPPYFALAYIRKS